MIKPRIKLGLGQNKPDDHASRPQGTYTDDKLPADWLVEMENSFHLRERKGGGGEWKKVVDIMQAGLSMEKISL